jgi:hypothetical protein
MTPDYRPPIVGNHFYYLKKDEILAEPPPIVSACRNGEGSAIVEQDVIVPALINPVENQLSRRLVDSRLPLKRM